MLPWETIDRATGADGVELSLLRRGSEWVVRAGAHVLMSSRLHGSEETLARYALERVPAARDVLVGGLGLGFTLRAALDALAPNARVTVAELSPELVAWNRTHVADLAQRPLDDRRVRVHTGDVFDLIRDAGAENSGTFDLLLLDVDNGPAVVARHRNARLYSEEGVRTCARALKPGGVVALWSAGPDRRYEKHLAAAGFGVEVKSVSARGSAGGGRDVIFIARKAGGGEADGRKRTETRRGTRHR